MFFGNKKVNGYQVHLNNKSEIERKEDLKWFQRWVKAINSYGYMSENLGMELEELFKDAGYIIENGEKNYLGYDVGIHLTGQSIITEELIGEIFEKGLVNNGGRMDAARKIEEAPDLTSTVTFFKDIIHAVNHLKNGQSYKFSKGAFIIKIPHEMREDTEHVEYFDGNVYRILPNYIYGFVPLKGEGIVGELIKNPNFKLEEKLTR